ncbi:hypothetical protein JCM13580A_31430 [Streptomyces drozdowiczii]
MGGTQGSRSTGCSPPGPALGPETSGRVTVYFAALLARTEDGWEASDTELDDVETLSDLTDLAREASVDEDTVLVFIEQEDAWFGVVRVDGEEDPRIYVSDASAAARSSYGEILLTDELLGREPGAEDTIAALEELVGLDGTEDGEPTPADNDHDTTTNDDEDDDGPGAGVVPAGPIGDTAVLSDLGLPEAELLMLRTDALTEIADALGAAEVLETVR